MLSRRRLFEGAARIAGLAWLAAIGAMWRRPRARAADERTLAAYLDTLIPADQEDPGAIALGVPARLSAAAASNAEYAGLLEQFGRWLDERARATGSHAFGDLEIGEREAIVRAAESADPTSLPYRAFQRTRQDAFAHYYADARSWPGIGYHGPPQPDGFRDYNLPPQDRR